MMVVVVLLKNETVQIAQGLCIDAHEDVERIAIIADKPTSSYSIAEAIAKKRVDGEIARGSR